MSPNHDGSFSYRARCSGESILERKRGAERTEHNLLPVRRERAFRIVTGRVGEIHQIGPVLFCRINFKCVVVIPRIAALFSARAKFQFRLLFCQRLRICVRGGEDHAICARLEKAARRFACAGRDARRFARVQVEHVHLVKRIAFFALALKNQFAAIRRKITFPTPPAFED